MQEWLKELLTAVGGGTVVLIGTLTIFKGLFIKMFETGIESSFEKSLEKYKNKLDRSTQAYEILLDREMQFYKNADQIVAELIPLVQDLGYYAKKEESVDTASQFENLRSGFLRYCEVIKTLKNEILIHQLYIPQDVFVPFSDAVAQMQNGLTNWADACKWFSAGEYDKIDYANINQLVDISLRKLALAESKVRSRLRYLSGEDN